jgi:AraC-like DNA-binding protein
LAAALSSRERAWSPSLEFATSWAEVRSSAASTAPELLVFDPYVTGRLEHEPIVCFARQFQSCVMVGYSAFPRGCARDVLELSRAGVHAVATLDGDDAPRALADLLDQALEFGPLAQAHSVLERQLPPSLRGILPGLLFHASETLTPAKIACRCHCHPKTLRTYLRRAGLPSLAKLIVWTRLVRASHLLRDTTRPVENVALALGFASANSFRNQLLLYAGLRPTDLRVSGDPRLILARFEAALAAGRVTGENRFGSM